VNIESRQLKTLCEHVNGLCPAGWLNEQSITSTGSSPYVLINIVGPLAATIASLSLPSIKSTDVWKCTDEKVIENKGWATVTTLKRRLWALFTYGSICKDFIDIFRTASTRVRYCSLQRNPFSWCWTGLDRLRKPGTIRNTSSRFQKQKCGCESKTVLFAI